MGRTPAIEAEGLVKNYGKTKALAGFDLRVPAGTVYGLLGPNGAGKTTAVRVFATLLRPDGGRAQVLGHDVAEPGGPGPAADRPDRAVRGAGRVPHRPRQPGHDRPAQPG